MRKKLKRLIDSIFLPRWIIFFADMIVISFVFMFTYLLRYNLQASAVDISKMLTQLIVIIPFFALAEYIFKPYQGIIRHSSLTDGLAVIKSQLLGTAGILIINLIGRVWQPLLLIPWSVTISQFFIAVSLLIGIRFLIAIMYHRLVKKPVSGLNVMIFGAGEMGMMTKGVFEKDATLHYNLVGFIDDNPMLHYKKVEGLMVYPPELVFSRITDEKKVREAVICIPPGKISKERKSEFVDLCIARNIRVKEVPEAKDWLNGKFYASQIRDVMIEDLLGRDPIELDNAVVRKGVHGKKIMVTGAAGSIGSEIVWQLSELFPASIDLVDQAESPLYDLHNEIKLLNEDVRLNIIVADVTDSYRMRRQFEKCVPDIVFHASAYKHVPLMEQHPYDAILANVGGTKIMADLAVEFGVKKFVMISSDKAVNPSNVMGATKRICEMYTHSLSDQPGVTTQFITTRFGNVLGSNGSVIPLFRRQISLGGPVTVTHKEIIRYFMTISEACRLVLEAGFMGKGGEIYLFDMGKPVKIWELAEKMIRLSGFTPHKDIQIIETGLRPGEKLYEELLANREESLHTHNEKILISQIKPHDPKVTICKINDLVKNLILENEVTLVGRMKDIVPEYKSYNSDFEALDALKKDTVHL
jgi:FlaA1/EpsC-like NDP-sugar epimerase